MNDLTKELQTKTVHFVDTAYACSIDWEKIDRIITDWLEQKCNLFDDLFLSKDGFFIDAKGSSLRRHLDLPANNLEKKLIQHIDVWCNEQKSWTTPKLIKEVISFIENNQGEK